MQETKVHIFKEEDIPPLKSQNTWMIAAAMTSGIALSKDRPFSDTVEVMPDGSHRRATVWMTSPEMAKFDPIPTSEEVAPDEFRNRYLSSEWCGKNPDHPIAYMRHFSETYQKLRAYLRTHKSSAIIRRNGKVAIIDADCPQALKEKILSML
jgi:hypothetical protein